MATTADEPARTHVDRLMQRLADGDTSAFSDLYAALYPSHHPYSWDVIGYMDDLTAATKEDVEEFFKTYYGPNNCTLVIAGDIDPAETKRLVEKYFGAIPPGPPVERKEAWIPELKEELRLSMEDRVPLPRIYMAWHAPPLYQPGDADLDIHLYDSNGVDLTPCSPADVTQCQTQNGQSGTSNEHFEMDITTSGIYYVVVQGYDDQDENLYDIHIERQ